MVAAIGVGSFQGNYEYDGQHVVRIALCAEVTSTTNSRDILPRQLGSKVETLK
jgi:hypothetical protein